MHCVSSVVLATAHGLATCKRHALLICVVHGLYTICGCLFGPLCLEHVHAHECHPCKQRADALCAIASYDRTGLIDLCK